MDDRVTIELRSKIRAQLAELRAARRRILEMVRRLKATRARPEAGREKTDGNGSH